MVASYCSDCDLPCYRNLKECCNDRYTNFRVFASVLTLLLSFASTGRADSASLEAEVRKRAKAVEEEIIVLRRDIHRHPELGDQETADLETRRELPPRPQAGSPHRGGANGRRGHPQGRQTGSHGRPPRRHGCASGPGASGAAFRFQGNGQLSREDGPRHARLRARHAHRHAVGSREGIGGHER